MDCRRTVNNVALTTGNFGCSGMFSGQGNPMITSPLTAAFNDDVQNHATRQPALRDVLSMTEDGAWSATY